MGVNTKGIIRKGVTLEELVAHAEKEFLDVKVRTTHDDDFFYIEFSLPKVEGEKQEQRSMALFLDHTMSQRDYGIEGILLDVKKWGNSSKIITHFVGEFGGFFLEDDCSGDDFQALNIHKLELAKDYTEEYKLRLKVISKFGLSKANEIMELFDEYKNIK